MKRRGSANDPLWYKDAIIYEVHVRAFCDSNNDGIGDFPGLIQKLDYLQDLGVTCLWLLPFFPSPQRDDGYDISDYRNIHPSYGTLEDFQTFLDEAHARGMQVLIELVVNHTSDRHPWFQAARTASPGSPEREFYVWSDSDKKYLDARIIFTDTEKSNWTWDPEAEAYYWHRFFSHQPDLNFDNPAVVAEVVDVMRFWLDMGVDAMRLDAIPYLIEREGSNCENLQETHEIVKHIRRELDAGYEHRMILAEANQWPADVRAYFGDGDECHMAFHFPLMPRLFMSLRLEDRHPITEILAQTPRIPDNCQWGMFLRNHDELTLEMVTDEERDYMYYAYSADPQMRINVGIRRRLAPLMDNNRRRIELLNSILLSFPGTPIMYYGDEIGMGDNIYLGDRNGVRTPMQWNADRNAGFSRVTPGKLYSPVIMDPVYGYEAINIEAQQGDPSSLLNWTRHMIALRKLFSVFGRGAIEFLHPDNRKILAYLRSCSEDRILCVANLSRFAQPVELDLSAVSGMTPVEMLGYVEFPKITRAPYPLTLGPYGYLWFELHGTPEAVEVRATPETEEETAVLHSVRDWKGWLVSGGREALEERILPRFLPKQRWYGSKSRVIASCRIKDWGELAGSPAILALLDISYESGAPETYVLPLAITTGPAAKRLSESFPNAVLCPARAGAEWGVVHDAMFDDAACQALFTLILRQEGFRTAQAEVRAASGKALLGAQLEDSPAVGRSPVEQSNTSIIFDGKFILKLFRRLESGPNPDCELGRYLSEERGFKGVPAFAGLVEYRHRAEPAATLAMMQALVENQGDGWTWTLEELGRFYERVGARLPDALPALPQGSIFALQDVEIPDAVPEAIGISAAAAAKLGSRTAEMHLALGAASDQPDFAPEPVTPADLRRLAQELRLHAATVFDALKENFARLPDELVEQASLVLSSRRLVNERLGRLEGVPAGGAKIRIHGDYHLGQVLRVEDDYVILDFEGEPARSLAERRAKQSALKDVAGMLRSFGYAAYAALLNYTARRAPDLERLEPWAAMWERSTSLLFLHAYRTTAGGAPFLPADPEVFRALTEAYFLDKALYELRYEMNNRPSWVRIPLWGIISLGLHRPPAGA